MIIKKFFPGRKKFRQEKFLPAEIVHMNDFGSQFFFERRKFLSLEKFFALEKKLTAEIVHFAIYNARGKNGRALKVKAERAILMFK